MRKRVMPVLQNLGSLITYTADSKDCCLGYLMEFEGQGVYDAALGRVDVTPVDAKTHNKLFDESHVKGLDERCAVGQCGAFYLSGSLPHDPSLVVRTWLGTVVSDTVERRGPVVTFQRKGKTFRGRVRKNSNMVAFKRIA